MTIIYNDAKSVDFPATSIALGTFDGVHIAHQKIIDKAVDFGKKHNIPCGVMLFDSIPANTFSDNRTLRLMKPECRNEVLSYLDFIYIQQFDKNFYSKSPEEFVLYIKNILNAKFVSVGYNYRFGKFASGDAELLKKLCSVEGIEVCITEKTIYSGSSVSSTRIRDLVAVGNVKEAAVLLGRDFFLKGKVISGFQNGHKLGSPTANIELDKSVVLPAFGVYAGYSTVDGEKYASVINVGDNPTFNGSDVTVESHLLDFNGELYGKEIKVEFAEFLRCEQKFPSSAELVRQINIDIQNAERILKNYE